MRKITSVIARVFGASAPQSPARSLRFLRRGLHPPRNTCTARTPVLAYGARECPGSAGVTNLRKIVKNLSDRCAREGGSRCPCACRCGGKSQCGSRQRSHAGCKRWIKTSGDRVNPRRWLTRVAKLIIDFDELNLRKLFEVRHQRASDGIQRAIRLTIPCQINMHATICKDNISIACKTIEYNCKPLIPFNATRTLEKLIEYSSYNIL
jgi:hypothetical protein